MDRVIFDTDWGTDEHDTFFVPFTPGLTRGWA